MEWIKNNRFLAGLIGITVLCLGGMVFWGKSGATRYEEAKVTFDQAIADLSRIEKVEPYPIERNRAAKKKAIDDFRADLENLQHKYDSYRPGELKLISPEKFIDRLVEVNKATVAVCQQNALTLPEQFFCGFKDYTGKRPLQPATGVLSYQLEAVNEVLTALAQSGATSLLNMHRTPIEEEAGQRYEPSKEAIARALSLEFTFRGPEKSLRKFVTTLSSSKEYYWVIRSLRVTNEKKNPPRKSDAKFEQRAAAAAPENGGLNNIFNFEEPKEETPDTEAPAEEEVAAPASEEGERILALVLGNEELIVHLRVDLMLFDEPKSLP